MRDPNENFAKPLDLRLYTGTESRAPLEYSFNYLRGLLHDRTNKCWNCSRLNSCDTISKIKKCKHVALYIKEFQKRGLLK